jgi:hypothetical protein
VHTLSDITCRGAVGAAATDKGSTNADRMAARTGRRKHSMNPARAFEEIMDEV